MMSEPQLRDKSFDKYVEALINEYKEADHAERYLLDAVKSGKKADQTKFTLATVLKELNHRVYFNDDDK